MPSPVKKIISATYSLYDSNSPLSEMLNRAALNQEFFWGSARSFKESVKNNFLTDDFRNKHSELNSYSVVESFKHEYDKIRKPYHQPIDWMCFMGFKLTDPNWYLYRADRLEWHTQLN